MSTVKITADKRSDAVLVGYELSTESRFKSGSTTEEQYRGVLRVTIQQEAQNVSNVEQPNDSIKNETSLSVRFNRDSLVTLYPLKSAVFPNASHPFRLINQSYTPYESKGSTFFSGIKEYVSVTGWTDLSWSI